MFRGRINLFNEKTLYEFYDLKVEIGEHQSILRHVDLQHAWLISKEDTLGPRFLDSFVTVSRIIPEKIKGNIERYLKLETERNFIDFLNENVGLECLIKKGDVPSEVYKMIKGGF